MATMDELIFLYDGLLVEFKGIVLLLTGGVWSHKIYFSSESKHDFKKKILHFIFSFFPALFIKEQGFFSELACTV